MPVRLDKPWIPLTPEHIAQLPGHLGVYQLADAAGEIVYIGMAGGRSLFGLKGALPKHWTHRRLGDAVSLRGDYGVSHAVS